MARDIHMPLAVDEIIIPKGRRAVNTATVKKLAESIEKIGLRHPITVRRKDDDYILVAGLHRLEAHKKLGLQHVPSLISSFTNADARLWEIAENLHRAELSKLERDENIAEWVKIVDEIKVAQSAPVSGGRGNEGGLRAASRELGIERTDAQRAVKVAGLSDEAKDEARERGMDNNRTALLEAAKEKTPERQVAKVIQLSERTKDSSYSSAEWRRTFERHWRAGSDKDRDWARELIDRPIMDKGYG